MRAGSRSVPPSAARREGDSPTTRGPGQPGRRRRGRPKAAPWFLVRSRSPSPASGGVRPQHETLPIGRVARHLVGRHERSGRHVVDPADLPGRPPDRDGPRRPPLADPHEHHRAVLRPEPFPAAVLADECLIAEGDRGQRPVAVAIAQRGGRLRRPVAPRPRRSACRCSSSRFLRRGGRSCAGARRDIRERDRARARESGATRRDRRPAVRRARPDRRPRGRSWGGARSLRASPGSGPRTFSPRRLRQ